MEGLELTPEEEEGDAQVMALGDLRTKEGEGGGGGGCALQMIGVVKFIIMHKCRALRWVWADVWLW